MALNDDIKDIFGMAKKKKEDVKDKQEYATTGTLLFDLVAGGGVGAPNYENGYGLGIPYGVIVQLAGSSGSGKSYLAKELAVNNHYEARKKGENFPICSMDIEKGSRFDVEEIYGYNHYEEETPEVKTIEDMDGATGNFLAKLEDSGSKGIVIVDSINGLSSQSLEERATQREKSFGKNGEAEYKQSRDQEIASFLSKQFMRTRTQQIADTNAIFVAVSQLRQNQDPSPYAPKWIISGSPSLLYFGTLQLWLTVKRKITVSVEGVDKTIGAIVHVEAKKNRAPRPNRSCDLVLYYDSGFSDTASNLVFLYDLLDAHSKFKEESKAICWSGTDCEELTKDSYLDFIKENDLEADAKECRKKHQNSTSLTKTFAEEYIKVYAPEDVKAQFKARFGEVYDFETLVNLIDDSEEMQETLRKAVISKWERIEATAAALVPKKKKFAD